MIALDTNVLLRILLEDDREQLARALAVIEQAVEAGDTLFVSDVVLCEAAWVLVRHRRVPRHDLEGAFRQLLITDHLAFASPDRITRALDAFTAGRGDFADYLIREHARAAGCDAVVTFDQALLREDGFRAP